MDHAVNPGGGPGPALTPPGVPGIAVQGPLFTFGGDGIGLETDNVMLFTTASGRKRPRGKDGFDGESGPIRRILASQFGTVNAKLDKALGKMASQ
jgi:hypothetical protein